jgi:hypothetical protein
MLNRVQAQAKFRMTTVNTERQNILCVESGNSSHYLKREDDLADLLLLKVDFIMTTILQGHQVLSFLTDPDQEIWFSCSRRTKPRPKPKTASPLHPKRQYDAEDRMMGTSPSRCE